MQGNRLDSLNEEYLLVESLDEFYFKISEIISEQDDVIYKFAYFNNIS